MKFQKKVIIYIQTDFQKMIADKLLSQYDASEVEILDCRNFKFNILDKDFFINCHEPLNIIKTYISFLKNNIDISCETLIGSHITSFSSFFITSIIEYKNLNLIDDGIGTPVILENDNYWNKTRKNKFKNFCFRVLTKVFFNKKFKSVKEIIRDVNLYSSVYDFDTFLNKEKIYIYKNIDYKIGNSKALIGSPFCEFNYINKKKYVNFIKKVISKEGPINYYAHPNEYILKNEEIKGFNYIEANTYTVEERFLYGEMPKIIISFYSSAIINLKTFKNEINIFYVKNNLVKLTTKDIHNSYEKLLIKSKIPKYPIELIN